MNNSRSSTWKRLSALSEDQLQQQPRHYNQTQRKIAPSYYCDINGKELIVILKRDYPSSENTSLKHSRCDSYLDDVEVDSIGYKTFE